MIQLISRPQFISDRNLRLLEISVLKGQKKMTLEWYYMEKIHVYTAGSRDRVIWFTGRQNYVDLCKRRISNCGVFPYDKGILCILTCCRLLIMCEWLILIDWLNKCLRFIYRKVSVKRGYTYMYTYMNLKLQWYSYGRYWYSL